MKFLFHIVSTVLNVLVAVEAHQLIDVNGKSDSSVREKAIHKMNTNVTKQDHVQQYDLHYFHSPFTQSEECMQ